MQSRLFTGASKPHAAHRLLQLSRPASTPPKTQTRSSCGKPPSKPVAPKRQPSNSKSGVENTRFILSTPTTTPLPSWIFPNLVCPDTQCHSLVPRPAWKALRGGRCGIDLSRTSSPSGRYPKATYALRAASLPSHDGWHVQPHPRCLHSPNPVLSNECHQLAAAPFLPLRTRHSTSDEPHWLGLFVPGSHCETPSHRSRSVLEELCVWNRPLA